MSELAADLLPGLKVIRQLERPAPSLTDARVVSHTHLGDRYWQIELHAPLIAATSRPGQFVMLTVASSGEVSPTLPRPMAVYETSTHTGNITVVYGVLGPGTLQLSRFAPEAPGHDVVTTVGPLGQGFTLDQSTRGMLVLGRGIGTCSLVRLAGEAHAQGAQVTAVDSARTQDALVVGHAYGALGVAHLPVTDTEGSSAIEVLEPRLLQLLDDHPPQQIAVCGSARFAELARRLGHRWRARVEVSLEAHMACGLGYCHGCSRGERTAESESPLVCADGPTFRLDTSAADEVARQ